MVALALDESQRLRGFALSRAPLPTSERVTVAEEKVSEEHEQPGLSPTANKAYVNLVVPGGDIQRLVTGGRFNVVGRGFASGAGVEVLIDGNGVAKAMVGDDGTFKVAVVAPQDPGVHTLVVRDAASQKILDGVQLKVNRGEAGKEAAQGKRKERREEHGEHEEDERAGERVKIKPPVRGL